MGRITAGEWCRQLIRYQPLPSQWAFHRCRARFKGFSGPVGSGKSQALCHEAIRLAYLNSGRTGLLAAPTYGMLRDATVTALVGILEENSIPYELRKTEGVLRLLDPGSRILLRSLDEPERLRGTNLAWFGVDELTYAAEDAWTRLEARLRDPEARHRHGFAVWTPKGFDWVYRRFIARKVAGYEVIFAKPYENVYLLNEVPDYYDRLRSSYGGEFFAQEVLGQYVNTAAGRVYQDFDRQTHVRDVTLDPNLPVLWALDFNVNPLCSLIAQRIGDELRVLGEIVLSGASTADACREFLQRFGKDCAGVHVYGDASGNARRTSGPTDYEIIKSHFEQAGLRGARFIVPKQNPGVRDRITLVNAKLRNARGESTLVVSPLCEELIADFEQTCYKPNSTVIDKTSDPRRSHLTDALGYLIWQEFKTEKSAGPRNRPLLNF